MTSRCAVMRAGDTPLEFAMGGSSDRTRILLIAPTALDWHGRPITQRKLYLPGLTLAMLAAVTPDDCELRLCSESVHEIPFDDPWDLVGLSGMGSGIARAWQIGDEFRRRGRTVVLGGIAASLGPPETMLAHADAVVLGEAEEVWPQVVRDAQAGRLKPIYRAAERPPIEALPLPRYDLMNTPRYGRWRPVQAARGCPFTCDYCSITAYYNGRYRKRPVEQVLRDVREAKRLSSRYIAFIDDNIGVDWDYSGALWEALVPERIIWMSQCSIHIADRPDMLALAYRSGCRILSIGIESTNPDSLARHDKAWNRPERYAEAVARIRAHGVDVSTEMIVGMDGDDGSVFERTFRFLMDNRISVPRVHILTPIPGTPLWDRLRREGRLLSEDFSKFSGGRVVFQPAHFSPDDLLRRYWDLYERLFSRRAILHRTAGNPARLPPFLRAIVWAVNLHYRGHVRRRITPGLV